MDNMVTHADYIKNVLLREDVYPIIKNGSPLYIQFEDFWRYVKSDTPGYIETLKKYIENKKKNGKRCYIRMSKSNFQIETKKLCKIESDLLKLMLPAGELAA
ncbi:hypothetical protein NXV26_04355 [Bacteroides fragilis]|nr:hypothetical protein [Bacteroides fragilis]